MGDRRLVKVDTEVVQNALLIHRRFRYLTVHEDLQRPTAGVIGR
jgi:hypothetical protein